MDRGLKAIVLAAGKGTRLAQEGSDLPKVMRLACGRPLLHYVLEGIDFIKPEDVVIVVGYQKEKVMSAFPEYAFAEQREQLGTGHAAMAAAAHFAGYDGDVLVCCGDMPLISRETYTALVKEHRSSGNACTMLTGTSDVKLPFGRILRDENGEYLRIIEEKDCTPEQLKIRELNSGVYIFDSRMLFDALRGVKNDNSQHEYYITDVPPMIRDMGGRLGVCFRDLGDEIVGVNTPDQLKQVEEILSARS